MGDDLLVVCSESERKCHRDLVCPVHMNDHKEDPSLGQGGPGVQQQLLMVCGAKGLEQTHSQGSVDGSTVANLAMSKQRGERSEKATKQSSMQTTGQWFPVAGVRSPVKVVRKERGTKEEPRSW